MSRMMDGGKRRPDKRAKGRLVTAVLAAIGLFALANDASAFCRSTTCRSTSTKDCATDENSCTTEGAQLFWPTSCIGYATNKRGTADFDPTDTRAVIKKCFEAWSDVQCADGSIASMTFQERDPVPCAKSEYNKTGHNLNVVLFKDDNWTYHGIDGTLAKTSVTYNDDTGEIYDADIEINAAYNQITLTDDPAKADTDLQAILTHEVGHFIGIAHSPDDSAVMFASYNPGSLAQRVLKPDDIKAVCAIYPAHNGVVCNTEPRGGFSATCDDPPSSGICSIPPTGTTSGTGASLGVTALFVGAGLLAARARRRKLSGVTRVIKATGGLK